MCVCVRACVHDHVITSTCSPGAILRLALTVMSVPSLTHQQLGSQEWFRRAGLGERREGHLMEHLWNTCRIQESDYY